MQGLIGRTRAGVAAVVLAGAACAAGPAGAGEGGTCSPAEAARLLASDGAGGDILGFAVAIDGDTAIVGAMGDEPAFSPIGRHGAAYIFTRAEVGGGWTQQAKLTASDGVAGDNFGIAVGIDGDTAVVGAYSPLGFHPGAAYVFERAGGVWSEVDRLSASDEGLFDYFGVEVAIEGDRIVVGASKADVGRVTDAGAAYVFERSPSGWRQRAKLTASDGDHEDHFGAAFAMGGDTIVVGAPDDNRPAGAPLAVRDAGSAYVFVGSGGHWAEQAILASPQPRFVGTFGYGLALRGDSLFIGEPSPLGPGPGSAYVLQRSAGAWALQARLDPSDGAARDDFGVSIAFQGDIAIIGAARHDTSAGIDSGAAYLFELASGAWTERTKLAASDAAAEDGFGISTALDGDVAVVGMFFDDTAAGTDAGSATVFDLNCGEPVCAADVDGDGGVDVFDLLGYLDLWFALDAGAERTGDAPASIDVFDLLAYLEGWFAGCG